MDPAIVGGIIGVGIMVGVGLCLKISDILRKRIKDKKRIPTETTRLQTPAPKPKLVRQESTIPHEVYISLSPIVRSQSKMNMIVSK